MNKIIYKVQVKKRIIVPKWVLEEWNDETTYNGFNG